MIDYLVVSFKNLATASCIYSGVLIRWDGKYQMRREFSSLAVHQHPLRTFVYITDYQAPFLTYCKIFSDAGTSEIYFAVFIGAFDVQSG